jgi:plastocyanin
MRPQVTVLAFAVAVTAAVACSSSSTTGTGGGGGGHSNTITASSSTRGGAYGSGGNFFFSPTPDTVAAGTAVTFTVGSVVHNITFANGQGAPANIPATSNSSTMRTFPAAGTYNYTCTIHGFSGVLVVQ